MATRRVTMAITGLGCGGGGALTVEHALTRVPGVVRAYVNAATEMAYVEYEPSQTDAWQLGAAVRRVGFDVDLPSTLTRRTEQVTD